VQAVAEIAGRSISVDGRRAASTRSHLQEPAGGIRCGDVGAEPGPRRTGEYAHARDLLRQALLIDSGNSTGRALLEKVNTELRRVMIRPKAQLQVDKGKALLEEGKIEEAKAAADSALQMDSSFLPAQELRNLVQEEIERVQRVADWLDGAKQLIAEGMPEDAEMLLAKVFDAEPSNKRAGELKQEALKQRAERKRRLELIEKMQAARSLWTQQKYAECAEILTKLQKEYPEEDESPGCCKPREKTRPRRRESKIWKRRETYWRRGVMRNAGRCSRSCRRRFPTIKKFPVCSNIWKKTRRISRNCKRS